MLKRHILMYFFQQKFVTIFKRETDAENDLKTKKNKKCIQNDFVSRIKSHCSNMKLQMYLNLICKNFKINGIFKFQINYKFSFILIDT